MRRRTFLASALGMGCLPQRIAAQGVPTPARIGWLTAQRAPSLAPYVDTLRAGLAELGHEEGRNIVIESRYGDDKIERVPELAMELISASGGPYRCAGRSRFGRPEAEPPSPHRVCDQR